MTKGAIHQQDITIVNVQAPNIGATNFIKQTLLDIKAQIDPNTILVYDLFADMIL
jgi:hypothetical protein